MIDTNNFAVFQEKVKIRLIILVYRPKKSLQVLI
ncbi:hypothetical protein SAMN05421813_1041 [Daejeonella rubra]|uniref:Uncharacterized protein n=1 Tax=Daejeonella rubra TaxID=990371 RepID=A0A1G9P5W2_9SPHI|nr:hypothetical protein SAMN05421813_1041 [Daejeonella rubra]